MATNKDGQWVTINGRHILIGSGESREDVIKRVFGKNEESDVDRRDRQIAERQQLSNRLNAEHLKTMNEIPKQIDPKEFVGKVSSAKKSGHVDDSWRVDDTYSDADYARKGCKCFITDKGSTVAVTKTGDIISVCRNDAQETGRGVGSKLLQWAVKNGGIKLDSFGGNHGFYVKNGFEPVAWTPFSPKKCT